MWRRSQINVFLIENGQALYLPFAVIESIDWLRGSWKEKIRNARVVLRESLPSAFGVQGRLDGGTPIVAAYKCAGLRDEYDDEDVVLTIHNARDFSYRVGKMRCAGPAEDGPVYLYISFTADIEWREEHIQEGRPNI